LVSHFGGEHRLRVFENKVLKKIFGPEREEDGPYRKLYLHNLYSSPNIVRVIKSRRMRWARHVVRMGKGRGVYRISVGKPERRRPLGRPRRRWDDNIKMDLREIGMMGGTGFGWLRVGSSGGFCEHCNESLCSIKEVGYF
jgi:hypothetical protein